MNPVVQTLLLIIDCLAELNIDYAVMGGLAVRAHAIPRPTNDVDLTVALSRDRLQGWFAELGKKLIASRPRDLVDVADILFIQGELDEPYMRKWAVLLGVESQLEQALSAP